MFGVYEGQYIDYTLKELNAAISPESNSNELFRDVLNTSNVARIALFKGVPVGFIFAEKKLNNNGSYHLSIVTIGVKADKQKYGIAGELIKHIDNLAQETEDIKFMTAFVQNKNDVATRLFERCDFERCSCPNHFGTYTGCFFFKSSQ
uniref:N-acetyltransferase domain-containing protein n=1 Tax=Caenorhabditis tropicalis TaxID=1561998 RepID=A0A1I7UES9_9PELO